jgi:histidine ammonia-lyase
MTAFRYGSERLSAGVALDIGRGRLKGTIDRDARERIAANRRAVESIVHRKQVVYGINTGFGPLCTTVISEADTRQLQYNLLASHAVGVGELLPAETAKLMMILKVQALAWGYSGVSPETLERILWHIEREVVPCVPSQGSVGASGDLAPLAHLFLPLIGAGRVTCGGESLSGAEALKRHGLAPLDLGPKEGLALVNGTQFITANALLFLDRFQNCLDAADLIAAMHLDAILGSVKPFDRALHELRPYEGSLYVAGRMRTLLDGSEINASHRNCNRVQDPYSLRCIPQVHGAARNAWLHLKELLEIEINSVTDNPIIFDEEKAVSGGNFHGEPIALPIDYAALAASELGNIADRRIYLALDDRIPGLPKLLMRETGLNSGFMITQYTTAALVSENKSLCYPASADSIPTSLGQEDHVSMGAIGARKALRIVDNLEKILGIELFCAAQAFDYRKPLRSGKIIDACHEYVRGRIAFVDRDRVLADDIQAAIAIVKNKELIHVANEVAEKEGIDLANERHERFGIY